jgi:uncharacterized protein (TIGR02118 family)
MKKMVFVRKRSDIRKKDFENLWLKEHAEFFRNLPGVKRYVINLVVQPLEEEGMPYDGIAELWYDNEDDFRRTENSEEFKKFLKENNPRFQSVPDRRSVLVKEYIIK